MIAMGVPHAPIRSTKIAYTSGGGGGGIGDRRSATTKRVGVRSRLVVDLDLQSLGHARVTE
jgi:hypothetical protein